MLPLPGGRLT